MEQVTKADYEYLDHTADIQLHSWGPTINEAFEQNALAMFNYISELKYVDINEADSTIIEVEGHDLESLLYSFMNEFLMAFCIDKIVCKKITILHFDKENFKIKAKGQGEKFDKKKHPQGTEIKAITYSAMQIHEKRRQN